MSLRQTKTWHLTLSYQDPSGPDGFEVLTHPCVYGEPSVVLNWRDNHIPRKVVIAKSELKALLELLEGEQA